ncbi:uncharacterized protein LOC123545748 [Mercenaria mercenaria]|uniref:uncharacterized protein LOC123545748 n=1 Tax=Mercenaria mercenaria TaxID=6596 RepID=UPI00234F8EFD|nr:uncharacterized protein LOC123545748 [Mercenaria mercenaria]
MDISRDGYILTSVVILTVLYRCHASPDIVTCDDDKLTDGKGVFISAVQTYYECEYLKNKTYPGAEYLGIYADKEEYCKRLTTDCCETCASILRIQQHENECQDVSIWLGDGQYECSHLLNGSEDAGLGIYSNREWICKMTTTQCCESCKVVNSKFKGTTSPAMFTPEGTPDTTDTTTTTTRTTTTSANVVTEITHPEELQDDCKNNCIWLVDGLHGRCEWLLDPKRSEYNVRVYICTQGFAEGCKRTCGAILRGVTDTTITTVEKAAVTEADCTDSHIMVDKRAYDCSELGNANSDLYNLRSSLCESEDTVCCLTCRQLHNEKQSSDVKYNEENAAKEKDNVVVAANILEVSVQFQDPNTETIQHTNDSPVMMMHVMYTVCGFTVATIWNY